MTIRVKIGYLGMYPKRIKLFEDIQRMNQPCDPTVDSIAGSLCVISTVHAKCLSQNRWTARASDAKAVLDK